MDLAALEISVTAKLDDAIARIDALENKFTTLSTSATKLGPALDSASRKLAQSGAATAGLTGGMTKVTAASNSATLAMTNMGRVVQDLPFGFVGISNNLNPLLESMQRLSVESKAAGVSLGSTLLKSLTGAGGLGFALSIVSSALTFASFGLSAWTRGFSHATKATEDHKKAIDEYTQALNKSYQAAGQQLSQVAELVAAAERQDITVEHRKKALQDLQNISGTYFDNLKIENGIIVGLSQAYEDYANNILKVARAKAAEETVQKLSTELVKTSDAVNGIDKGLTNLNLTFTQASKLLSGQTTGNAFKDIAAAGDKLNEIVKSGLPNFEELKLLSDATGLSEAQINQKLSDRQQLKTKELSLTAQIASLSAFIAQNDDKSAKATTAKVDQVAKILQELKDQLRVIDLSENGDPVKKFNAIYDAIKRLLDLKVPEGGSIIQNLIGDANKIFLDNLSIFTKQFGEKINKNLPEIKVPLDIAPTDIKEDFFKSFDRAKAEIEGTKFGITLPLNFKFASNNEIENIIKKINDAKHSLDSLEDSIKNVVSSGLQSFFVNLADSISGSTNPFEAFANIMAEGLKTIGQALIKYGIEVGVIQKIFRNPFNPIAPALAIGAGFALEALGAALQKSIKIPGLAEGGIIPAGYPNDTYPALLSSNEAVIPLNKMQSYLSPTHETIVIIPEHRISGNDIVLSYDRTVRKNSRSY